MNADSQAGFSMIEVLIALLVLSVGLLGLASVQLNGMRGTHDSYLRSAAVIAAQDMADRIIANRAGAGAGAYDNPTPQAHASCVSSTGCAPTAMAAHDYFEWTATLADSLPGGSGEVCIDGDITDNDGDPATTADCDGSGTDYVITVGWSEKAGGAGAGRNAFALRVAP